MKKLILLMTSLNFAFAATRATVECPAKNKLDAFSMTIDLTKNQLGAPGSSVFEIESKGDFAVFPGGLLITSHTTLDSQKLLSEYITDGSESGVLSLVGQDEDTGDYVGSVIYSGKGSAAVSMISIEMGDPADSYSYYNNHCSIKFLN